MQPRLSPRNLNVGETVGECSKMVLGDSGCPEEAEGHETNHCCCRWDLTCLSGDTEELSREDRGREA